MELQLLSPLLAKKKYDQGALFVDIRSLDAYQREHIPGAIHLSLEVLREIIPSDSTPLSSSKNASPIHDSVKNKTLLSERYQQADTLIFQCQSGVRTRENTYLLKRIAENKNCFILEKGIDGWKKAGFTTQINARQPLPLMQQVQIVAGSLALLGTIAGYTLSPWFYIIPGFVGAGLLTAGLTGFCGMARLLIHMPWNKALKEL